MLLIYIILTNALGLLIGYPFSTHLRNNSFDQLSKVRENFCMQLASIQSPNIGRYISSVLSDYEKRNITDSVEPFDKTTLPSKSRQLSIGWFCGDVSYHPVGRFLYGLMHSLSGPTHSHTVVDVQHHSRETRDHWFKEIANINYLNVTNGSFSEGLNPAETKNLILQLIYRDGHQDISFVVFTPN